MLKDRVFSPREYFEHQLNMSEEEKEQRRVIFTDLFDRHEAEKAKA